MNVNKLNMQYKTQQMSISEIILIVTLGLHLLSQNTLQVTTVKFVSTEHNPHLKLLA